MTDSTDKEPIKFDLSPDLISTDIIDYSTASVGKIYTTGTSALSAKAYDLDPMGLLSFMSKLRHRSINMGWTNIMMIPENAYMTSEEEKTEDIF